MTYTSPPPPQLPLIVKVQLPTREAFLANGVRQLELILLYGHLEEYALMIDIHGNLDLNMQKEIPIIALSDHSSAQINSFPAVSNNEVVEVESLGDPGCSSSLNREGETVNSSGDLSPLPSPLPRTKSSNGRNALYARMPRFNCQICDKNSCNMCTPANHSSIQPNLNLEGNKHIKKQVWKKNQCYFCSKQFKAPSLLYQHLVGHTREKAHPCAQCNKQFNRKSSLISHLTTHHRRHNSTRRPFPCSKCDQSFSTKGSLLMHQRIHDDDPDVGGSLNCEQCGKLFSAKQNLATHVNAVHLRLKDFACPGCDRKFARKSDMSIHHSSKHLKIRHPCPRVNCGKAYLHLWYLRQHEKKAH